MKGYKGISDIYYCIDCGEKVSRKGLITSGLRSNELRNLKYDLKKMNKKFYSQCFNRPLHKSIFYEMGFSF